MAPSNSQGVFTQLPVHFFSKQQLCPRGKSEFRQRREKHRMLTPAPPAPGRSELLWLLLQPRKQEPAGPGATLWPVITGINLLKFSQQG